MRCRQTAPEPRLGKHEAPPGSPPPELWRKTLVGRQAPQRAPAPAQKRLKKGSKNGSNKKAQRRLEKGLKRGSKNASEPDFDFDFGIRSPTSNPESGIPKPPQDSQKNRR